MMQIVYHGDSDNPKTTDTSNISVKISAFQELGYHVSIKAGQCSEVSSPGESHPRAIGRIKTRSEALEYARKMIE